MAAIRVQAMWRGRKGRLSYHLKLQAKRIQDNIIEETAALKLQRLWRGRHGRKEFKKKKQAYFIALQQMKYKSEIEAKRHRDEWEKKIRETEEKRLLEIAAREKELQDRIEWETKQLSLMAKAEELKALREAKEREDAKLWDKYDDEESGVYYENRETGET